jgi:genome maintenance exonuclease 1
MKTFTRISHDFPSLVQVNSDAGRLYKTPQGRAYPSVTSVTGLHGKADILAWRNRVGAEVANQISGRAIARGNQIHKLCEHYLLNEGDQSDDFSREEFSDLMPVLDRIDNIHCLESRLHSHHLETAGTVDCIAEFDGKLTVIDFKTSSRMKTAAQVPAYWMQTAAYAVMFEELTGIPVQRTLIIMSVADQGVVLLEGRRDNAIDDFIHFRDAYRKLKGI